MTQVERKLLEMGVQLVECPKPGARYVPVQRSGNLLFASGQTSVVEGELLYAGKLGRDVSDDDGYESAKIACLRCISALAAYADLDNLRIIKVTGFVNTYGDYGNQPSIVNGASDLIEDAFGEKGQHARAAIGVAGLPGNASVEIELIAEVIE
ncbi:MAG TPA: RidA family protein [Clostridiaceae bacterium]|jgi:enamine deaminase RidA (YjgF/YER057c/UK114 family)|nr:RidA family protein [Clostridiaceae bacterium]